MKYSLTTLFVLTFFLLHAESVLADATIQQTLPQNFVIIIGEQRVAVDASTLHTWFTEIPSLQLNTEKTAEIENVLACIPSQEPCALRMTTRDYFSITKEATYLPNRYVIAEYVTALAQRIGTTPTNATLDIINGRVTAVTPHKNGLGINQADAVDAIMFALENGVTSVELDYTTQFADIRADNLEELGLRELIGEGVSDFTGSTLSRIHNIKTAADKFDGLLVAPGEEFSFVEHLGPVDGEHGFKKELVIKDNQTTPEYGGGICQVSTTVFRAAVLTGMEITQRRNHSYPVHYYSPIGFDATIYIPSPDMRFKNNTAHYIMFDMVMEGNELVFRFYGTKDGRTVEMVGPIVTQKNSDGSMKTYFTQTVTDAKGTVLIDDTFTSNYKSPNAYPRSGQEVIFTSKPADWSKKQWSDYTSTHNL